jgi:hypothetical protein
MEVTLGGALPPARGDLDDLATSLMRDSARLHARLGARSSDLE